MCALLGRMPNVTILRPERRKGRRDRLKKPSLSPIDGRKAGPHDLVGVRRASHSAARAMAGAVLRASYSRSGIRILPDFMI